MKRFLFLFGLFSTSILPLCAQSWTKQDSLRLQQLLQGEGELILRPEVLKELEMSFSPEGLRMSTDQPWMDFDTSLPVLPEEKKPRVRLTLNPYATSIRYDYDPVYKKKIKVDKDTWKSDPFAPQTALVASLSHIKKELVNTSIGIDLMYPFTKECWDFRGRKLRKQTRKALMAVYGSKIEQSVADSLFLLTPSFSKKLEIAEEKNRKTSE